MCALAPRGHFIFTKIMKPLSLGTTPHLLSRNNNVTTLLPRVAFLIISLLLAACGSAPQTSVPTITLPLPEQLTPTASAPVALVNSEPISTEIFNIHLAQYQAALAQPGTLLASDNVPQIVLDDLVNRLLLAQAARAQGFTLDDSTLQPRVDLAIESAGGQAGFDAWLAAQGYTADNFRQELAIEIEAGWMRNEITTAVPLTAEQVLARQVLLTDRFQADRLLGQLQEGTSFEQMARNNDAQGLGYLGWFPRGYLLQPAVEEAAFALQPGEYSGVVETSLGFHLIELLDRDPDRALTSQARLSLQMKTLADWLAMQRAQSTIEILLP